MGSAGCPMGSCRHYEYALKARCIALEAIWVCTGVPMVAGGQTDMHWRPYG